MVKQNVIAKIDFIKYRIISCRKLIKHKRKYLLSIGISSVIADLGSCDENANATMYNGELECYCKDGFYGNGSYCRGQFVNTVQFSKLKQNMQVKLVSTFFVSFFYILLDINECENDCACHQNATCNNTYGSYECQCQHGFTGDGMNCTGKGDIKSENIKNRF